MTPDREELNKRRQYREQQRKKRQAQQRQLYLRLGLAAVVLLLGSLGIFMMSRSNGEVSVDSLQPTQQAQIYDDSIGLQQTQAATEAQSSRTKAPTVIHMAAAGDLNVTDQVVWSGHNSGIFDYTNAFMDVAPLFSEADISLLNFEGNFYGAPYGTDTVSAPVEMATALKEAGVDLLQVANSQVITNGINGLTSTLANIRSAGLEPVGAFTNTEEFKRYKGYTLCEVNGVTIAFVAFTKGMDGRGLPTGSENCVNLLYEDYYTTYQTINKDGITKILKDVAAQKPDLTVALLHWGSEYNDTISKSQKNIVTLMQKEGVDVILGTHSHMVEQIDYDEQTGALVAYSLGDFFGDASRSGTNYSIILDLEITKDNETGLTKVTNYSYTPIYTLSEDDCDGKRRVIRIDNAIASYEGNFVDKVTKSAYESMLTSLDRITDRVTPKADSDS